MDGVDAALVDFSEKKPRVAGMECASIAIDLRASLMRLNSSGDDELHTAQLATNALMRLYANAVKTLLAKAGLKPEDIRAIGAHGQTVRHRPQMFDNLGYTIQLCNPSLLAELTGIDVAADFRSRDVAAGGQGAPLAPFFIALGLRKRPAILVCSTSAASAISPCCKRMATRWAWTAGRAMR